MQPGTETPHRNARRGRLPARATRDNPGSLPEGKSTLITTDTQTELLREEIRAVADLLFRITDDVDTAVAKIMRLYRRHHSSRSVGDRIVLRLQSPLPKGVVEQWTVEFADALVEPWIKECGDSARGGGRTCSRSPAPAASAAPPTRRGTVARPDRSRERGLSPAKRPRRPPDCGHPGAALPVHRTPLPPGPVIPQPQESA